MGKFKIYQIDKPKNFKAVWAFQNEETNYSQYISILILI